MANMYYNFNNSSDFTLFIMAGIGVQSGEYKVKFTNAVRKNPNSIAVCGSVYYPLYTNESTINTTANPIVEQKKQRKNYKFCLSSWIRCRL